MATYLSNIINGAAPVPLSAAMQTQLGISLPGSGSLTSFVVAEIASNSDTGHDIVYDLSQFSVTTGAAAVITAVKLGDRGGPFPRTTLFGANFGGEPGYRPNTSAFNLTTKAAFRWRAAPGSEIVFVGLGPMAGYALRTSSTTYTGTIVTSLIVEE